MPAAVNKVNKMFKYSFFNFLIMYSSFILKFSLALNPPSNERERERNVSKQQQTQQETGAELVKQREAVSSKDGKQ